MFCVLLKFFKVPSKLRNGKEPVLIAFNLINASCSSFPLYRDFLLVTTNHLNLAHCMAVMSLQSSECIFHSAVEFYIRSFKVFSMATDIKLLLQRTCFTCSISLTAF